MAVVCTLVHNRWQKRGATQKQGTGPDSYSVTQILQLWSMLEAVRQAPDSTVAMMLMSPSVLRAQSTRTRRHRLGYLLQQHSFESRGHDDEQP